MTTFQRDMTFPADRYEEWFDKARAYVDKLTLSLLSSAVADQLVPRDHTDEPAEMLLQRVHSSRIAST